MAAQAPAAPTPPSFTREQKLEELGVMLSQRKKDFPRAVALGRMSQERATHKIEILRAIKRDLRDYFRSQRGEKSK